MCLVLIAVLAGMRTQEASLEQALRRLSEEAEIFVRVAPKVIGREILKQRARRPAPRFRPRIGKDAHQPPPPRYQTREIVSEYGYSAFQEAPESLHEFRQIVSVDGRKILNTEKARKLLVMGVSTADDKLKHKLLRDFEKYGLHGAATDLAPLLLLFTRRQLDNYTFAIQGKERIGAESALCVSYTQKSGPAAVTVFTGRQAARVPLEGMLWVRAEDSLPLRIRLAVNTVEQDKHFSRTATVDYFLSPHGVLLPMSVSYLEQVEGADTVENQFSYEGWRMFKVDAELKFTFEETAPAPAPAPVKR
ncbi:MAG: hypothetical protein ACRD44_02730 [Bryobacteraceae bacterium]